MWFVQEPVPESEIKEGCRDRVSSVHSLIVFCLLPGAANLCSMQTVWFRTSCRYLLKEERSLSSKIAGLRLTSARAVGNRIERTFSLLTEDSR